MAIYSGFSHQKWWFSIAMLVYQRVATEDLQWASPHPCCELDSWQAPAQRRPSGRSRNGRSHSYSCVPRLFSLTDRTDLTDLTQREDHGRSMRIEFPPWNCLSASFWSVYEVFGLGPWRSGNIRGKPMVFWASTAKSPLKNLRFSPSLDHRKALVHPHNWVAPEWPRQKEGEQHDSWIREYMRICVVLLCVRYSYSYTIFIFILYSYNMY